MQLPFCASLNQELQVYKNSELSGCSEFRALFNVTNTLWHKIFIYAIRMILGLNSDHFSKENQQDVMQPQCVSCEVRTEFINATETDFAFPIATLARRLSFKTG
jgi:hypothetical protein